MIEFNESLKEWQRFNVVQGVLVKDNHLLLVGNDYGGEKLVWSLPGGRLEPGEQAFPGLVREFKEETNLEVTPVALLYVVDAMSRIDRRHYMTCVFSVEFNNKALLDWPISCSQDTAVKAVRMVKFEEAAKLLLKPSLGEPLLNYLYSGLGSPRYWSYPEYNRPDWVPVTWPPSTQLQSS